MYPALTVKLRPTGPWRIGPDSGARNRVDVVYHSDSLYSAVASAMARLGALDEWLDATARNGEPAVSFSSCFPFLDEIRFVVPPRTIWPPTSPALMSARVRWKSARFVPLEVVQTILAGQAPDENHWSVDGPSECLVPAGRPGPFRTGIRWSAAVDRLTGATERHSTACIEFRSGAGLWTIVGFQDEAARERWLERVKAAFRLLADTGFGGERSRGWGRTEAPEFVDGVLPDMMLGGQEGRGQGPEAGRQEVGPHEAALELEASVEEPPAETISEAPVTEPPVSEAEAAVVAEPVAEAELAAPEPILEAAAPEPPAPEAITAAESVPEAASLAPVFLAPVFLAPDRPVVPGPHAHWLLSLFTPALADSVDWRRGNYIVLTRGGRVDSSAGSGELKKQIQMVAEGSVLYADTAPCGTAANVAPDGFAHPVFRAGFALAIPLPGPEGAPS